MKPKRVIIRTVMWDCGKHRHNSKEIAQRCVDKRVQSAEWVSSRLVWSKENLDRLLAERDSGKTWREVGDVFGIDAKYATSLGVHEQWARGLRS